MAENRNFDLNSNFQFSEIPLKKRKDSRLCNSTPSSSCTEGSSSGNPLKKRYFEPLFSYSEGSTSSHGSSAKERVYLGLSTDEEENNVCVNPSAIHAENRIPLLQAIDDKISYLKEEVENMKPETLWKPDKHAIDDKISYLKEEVENMKPETLWKPDKDSLNYFSALTNTFMAPDLNSEQKEFALNVSKSNDTGCSEIEDLSCKINVLYYSQSSENFVEPTSTAFPQLPLTHNNLNTSTDNSYHSHTMSLTGDGGFLPEERYNMNSDYAAKFALNIPSSKTGLRILSPVSEKYKELVSYGKQHVCDKTELIQTTSNPSEELTNNRCPSTQVSNFLANPLQMFYAPVAERITVDDALDVLDSVSPKLRSSPLQESDHHSHRVTPSISDDAIKQDAYTFSNDLKHLNQASTSGLQIENDMFNKANSSEDDSDYDDSIPLKSFVKWLSTENKNKKNGDTNLHLNLMNPDSHLHEREVRLNKDTEVQETLENNQRNRDKQLVQYKDSEIDNKMGSTSKHNTVVINETSIKSNLPVSDSLYLKIQRKYAEIENLSNSNKPQHKGLDLNVPLKNLLPLPNVTETLQKKGLFFKDVSTHNYMLESKLTLKDDDENKRLIRSCLPENTKPDISKAFKSHFSEFEDIDGLYNVNQLQHHQNSDVKDQRLSNYKSLLCNKPTSFGYNKKPKKYFPNLSEDCAEGNKSGKQIPEKKTTEEFRSKLREFIKNSEFRPRQYMDSYIPEIPPEEAPTQETSWDLSVNLSLKSHTLPDTLDKSNRFFPKSYNEKSKPNIIDLSSGCDENGDADDDCSSDGVEVVEIVRRDKKSQNRSKQYFTVLDDDCTVLDPPKPFRRSGSLRCIDGMDSAKPSTSRALSPYTYFPLDMSNPLTSKKKSLFGASTSSSTSSEKEDADVIWDPVLPNSNEADYLSTSPESVIMCSSPESCPSPTKSAERSIEDEIIGSLQKAFENPPKRKRSGTSKNVPVLTIPEDECSSDESKSKVAKVVEEGKRQDFRSELECAICLENMSSKRGTSATTCGHVYCTPCITEVIEKKKMCPTCRNSLDPSQVHKLFLFG